MGEFTLCWLCWVWLVAGHSQDRAEVFPDILCSRVRWCSHAWPAWTTEHTLTLRGGPTPPQWPGATFPPKLCFMSRVRCSSHSLTFMFIQTHEAELGWETEAEQLGLKKDLTFSFHPISQQSWSRLSSICINNLQNRAHIHNFNVYFFISVQCFLACCDLFIIYKAWNKSSCF